MKLDENPWEGITSEGNEMFIPNKDIKPKLNKFLSVPEDELQKEIDIRKNPSNKKLLEYKWERRHTVTRQLTALKAELEIIDEEIHSLEKKINKWP